MPLSVFIVFAALFPVLAILMLLTLWRVAADVAGLVGWVLAAGSAWLVFQTPLPGANGCDALSGRFLLL